MLFVALAVVLCLILRPKPTGAQAFRIRFGNGETLTVDIDDDVTVVIRNGVHVDRATGEGEENVIRIAHGTAWMETATCPHQECIEQGRLDGETVKTRPLGPWIICAPHGVSIEYIGGGE